MRSMAEGNEGVRRADEAFRGVTQAAEEELGESLDRLFEQGDRLQREVVDTLFGRGAGGGGSAPRGPSREPERRPVESGRLDTSSFVVLGEGLAAGMVDLTLHEDSQRTSFPARVAEAMGRPFAQPLFNPPGIGQSPGFDPLPVRLPAPMQSTVLDRFPPAGPFGNLSVPGLTLAEALERRPAPPLVRRQDPTGSALNFVVGLQALVSGAGAAPTQLEAALRQGPTFALVALGYAEALDAATTDDPERLPPADAFASNLDRLLGGLRKAGAETLVTTVPDPLDTPFASSIEAAARVVRVEPADLAELYGLLPDDLVTVHGLHEIGFQLFDGRLQELSGRAVLSGATADALRRRISALNDRVRAVGEGHGAPVYDLHGLFRRFSEGGAERGAEGGVSLAGRRLGADYLGGLYSLVGYWPGATVHAVIANEIVELLNRTYGARFEPVDLAGTAAADPVAACRPAAGPTIPADRLPRTPAPERSPRPARSPQSPGSEGAGAGKAGAVVGGETLEAAEERLPGPLQLPEGLVQTLPLAKRASYFGDGIRAAHCLDPAAQKFGSCGNLLFGGLALVDSHLEGELTIRFEPPVDGVARFEIHFGSGFAGDDAVLSTPWLFRMPFRQARVDPVAGTVSSGKLDLATGEVTDLQVFARYSSDALAALVAVNPTFPQQPLSFPGQYGSAWARFEQRSDGLLDFSFYGSTFVPLGPGVVWPLNFGAGSGDFALVPAAGTAMHPHLALSTREPEGAAQAAVPDLPENTILELSLFTHNSCFGDKFNLQARDLGGEATGRSHLLGRLEIQLGERTGDSLPFAVSSLGPGGLLSDVPPSPITESFPGRLYRGPLGFNEFLRFPLRTYYLDGVYILDDPFDLSVGLLDLATGRSVGETLHRGFIGQDLIFALLRVEPRTPKDSFFFRGPARFEQGPAGQVVFRFKGEVRVPYPAGFKFPQPDLSSGFVVEAPSALDPYYWLHAVHDGAAGGVARGGEENVRASNGDRFSYSYVVPSEGPSEGKRGKPVFDYVNHSQEGSFTLQSLSWVDLCRRGDGSAPDTVTLAGHGVWKKGDVESVEQICAQVSTVPGAEYVGIQVGLGAVSNVNTKPADISKVLP